MNTRRFEDREIAILELKKMLFGEDVVRCKEARVLDNMQISNGLIHWNVPFLRVV
jgi:hypothetical protein